MSEQETAIEDNATVGALEGEEQVQEATDYSEMEQDKLIEMLKEKEEALAESKKSYDEFRSMNDRRSNELNERIAKMEGALEANERAAEVAAQQTKADPNQLLKEMQEAIEEDPANIAKYMMQFQNDFRSFVEEREANTRTDIESRIVKMSPVYKDNKDLIEKLVDKGMGLSEAVEIASEVGDKGKKVSQPATPTPPSTVEPSRSAGSSDVPVPEISAFDAKMMKKLGFTEKDVKSMLKDIAKEQESN